MEPIGGDLAEHDHEYEAVEWVDFDALPKLDLFPTERDLIGRAQARLDELEDRVAS
jgi:8-oxo-dGTP pyrophosphatase MutT (NUDIX family)